MFGKQELMETSEPSNKISLSSGEVPLTVMRRSKSGSWLKISEGNEQSCVLVSFSEVSSVSALSSNVIVGFDSFTFGIPTFIPAALARW